LLLIFLNEDWRLLAMGEGTWGSELDATPGADEGNPTEK